MPNIQAKKTKQPELIHIYSSRFIIPVRTLLFFHNYCPVSYNSGLDSESHITTDSCTTLFFLSLT
jgi:hypothetical protein